MSSPAPEPTLAPPGAGLPAPELFVARALFRWKSLTTSRRNAAAAIASSRDRVSALARLYDASEGQRRILIDRLRGLEDSSRYWSIFMTVAHVRIVNEGMAGTMRMLLAGRTPTRQVSTAAVKPDPSAGAGEIDRFVSSCDALLEIDRAAPSLKTKLRHAHPWFGELDAAGWFLLAGVHLALHYQQLERIQEQCRGAGRDAAMVDR